MDEKGTVVFTSEEGRKAILAKYDEVLGRWPSPRRVLDLPTRHGVTRAVCSGPEGARPVVFLHGSTSNAMSWIAEAQILSPAFRVIAVDMPGEPGYSEPVRFDLDGAAPAEWLSDVLDGLGVNRVGLCGISLGGWTALNYATSRPDRVERLALLCPAGVRPEKLSFLLRVIVLFACGAWGKKRLTELIMGGSRVPQEAVDYTLLMGRFFQPRKAPPRVFGDAELSRIACPVLFFAGLKDPILDSRGTERRLARLLPDLRAELDPEAGHVILGKGERLAAFFGGDKPPQPLP